MSQITYEAFVPSKEANPPAIPPGHNTLQNPVSNVQVARTFGYFMIDQVVSALQKEIRRGNAEYACKWGLELLFSGPVAPTTFLWNRLFVIAFEDVGVANPLAALVVQYYHQYKDNPAVVCGVITYLSESKKCRAGDWLAILLRDLEVVKPTNVADTYILALGGLDATANLFKQALLDKDTGKCQYFSKLLFFTSLTATTWNRGRRKGSGYNIVWVVLEETLGKDYIYVLKVSEISIHLERNTDRVRLLITHLILLHCNDRLLAASQDLQIPALKYPEAKFIDSYFHLESRIPIPVYAIDKHTGAGRHLDKNEKDFLLEGSIINNRDSFWLKLDDWLKAAYAKERNIALS